MDMRKHINPYTPESLKIAVIGVGHVGLPTALGLAELGWEVIGADQDEEKILQLKQGKSPFYEPGLQTLLTSNLASGKFSVTSDVASAIDAATVLFICVGTPQREDGEADLSQVEVIARLIAQHLHGYKLIVEKSTVPAVTALWIKRTVMRYANAQRRPEAGGLSQMMHAPLINHELPAPDFDVASNPEFLQEGKAVENFFRPDRIVLGVESAIGQEILKAIYEPLKRPILVTGLTTAELIKHAANAFLSMKISYINMVADVCEAVGADVSMVALGLGLDPRIGPDFLSAGLGFGGYCFPKDLKAFIHLAEKHGVQGSLLREVERVNRQRVDRLLDKLQKALWVVQDKTIGIWGLSFKPNTDDIREAPSLRIVEALARDGARLRLYDPQAMQRMQQLFPEQPDRLTYCSSPYEACEGADAVLLLTEWDEFRTLDLQRVTKLMELPILLDGRNLIDPEMARRAGLECISMGRGNATPADVASMTTPPPPVDGREYNRAAWK
ncbi:MAG TPA: UDP-glucose/GDP-mannose dehydrogenase family protein [Terriglobia bacterium]|nr:UDP-glucose/GDP-mannose dehydrogenase family protein [Terriglobia bacterium]